MMNSITPPLVAALQGSPFTVAAWDQTLDALWVLNFLGAAFASIFVIRRALRALPPDMRDAAHIDGCGFWRACWHVFLPRVSHAFWIVAGFVVLAACDDALAPLLEPGSGNPGFYALRLSARQIGAGGFGLLMAGCLLILPLVIGAVSFAIHFSAKDAPPDPS
jgi:ABC-type glycerol-3-phosphate transport system permease component